jgi:hypothetical protein
LFLLIVCLLVGHTQMVRHDAILMHVAGFTRLAQQ